jgi:ADP-heptose:LPS heptosyltransferase
MPLNRVLFVELLGGLGDLTIALAAIRALASSHPEAEVDVFCFQPYAELLINDPDIARVFTAPKGDLPDGIPVAKEKLTEVLANHHFDLVVTDTRYGGIDESIEQSNASYKETQLWNGTKTEERIEQAFLRNLVARGFVRPEFADATARLSLTLEERTWAEDWCEIQMDLEKPFVLFHPEAGTPTKCWPGERYISLGRILRDTTAPIFAPEDPPQFVIATGERPGLARAIAHAIGTNTVVMPKLSIRQFAAVAARASVMVSADTGPARVAAAVGTPVVALFGPTWWGRYGLPAPNINVQSQFQCNRYQAMNITTQPCWYGSCVSSRKTSCMEEISPTTVAAIVTRLLNDRQNQRFT